MIKTNHSKFPFPQAAVFPRETDRLPQVELTNITSHLRVGSRQALGAITHTTPWSLCWSPSPDTRRGSRDILPGTSWTQNLTHFRLATRVQERMNPRVPKVLRMPSGSTYLIQDSSSSMSRKNWCRRWDSFSLARREAAMLLIFWKRPLMVSRLSFTWEVSKALLVIRLSAWLFRSFRRSWGQGHDRG